MVRKVADNGTFYEEPPYAFEEEMELYRQMAAGPFKIAHRAPDERPRKSPQQSPEE